MLAHIGNIPVEESLPFLIPIVGLFIYIRRKEGRRRRGVAALPPASALLDPAIVQRVMDAWAGGGYDGVSAAHLPLLYPPGPDGLSAAELAELTGSARESVAALLDELEAHEYLDLDAGDGSERALLTLKGFGLVHATEDALVSAAGEEPVEGAGRTG
jgi:hypothetical protein